MVFTYVLNKLKCRTWKIQEPVPLSTASLVSIEYPLGTHPQLDLVRKAWKVQLV